LRKSTADVRVHELPGAPPTKPPCVLTVSGDMYSIGPPSGAVTSRTQSLHVPCCLAAALSRPFAGGQIRSLADSSVGCWVGR